MNKDREIAEALGVCAEHGCRHTGDMCGTILGKCHFEDVDRLLLLEKMREREDWPEFHLEIVKYYAVKEGLAVTKVWKSFILSHARDESVGIPVDFILTKGAFKDAAWEWLCGGKK